MSAGWIEWHGGACPVAPETMVWVEFRDGSADGPMRASDAWALWGWQHDGDDIARYRVAGDADG